MKSMATQTQEAPKRVESNKTSELKQTAEKNVKTLQAFWTKFNNDWVMNFAAGLAFNLITAIFPIVIAIIAIAGITFGRFDPSFQDKLIHSIENVFPHQIASANILQPALTTLSKNAGLLAFIAVIIAIFGGSRLFVSLEGYFSIIYHTRQRKVIHQNIMALGMLLIFVILVPLMVFASSIPALVQSILQATPVRQIPGNGLIFTAIGILTALIITWVLFEVIYIVVPNQHISFRNSWLGAVVAAIALQIYLIVFPFYVTHFLSNDTGQVGFAVILLFFFYYFAVILLLGAEINAFFAEGVRTTPDTVPAMVHELTSHLPTSKEQVQQQAPPSHKDVEPKDIRPKSEANHLENQEARPFKPTPPASLPEHEQHQPAPSNHTNHVQKTEHKSTSQGTSNLLIFVEALAGTALAFFVQFFNLKRKK
jgi:YihY family inner membrane protein